MKNIYLVGTPAQPYFCSYARDPTNPRRFIGFATCREAAIAESIGSPFIPGFFLGEDSPHPLSSLGAEGVAAALRAGGFEKHFRIECWEYAGTTTLYLGPEKGRFWFDEMTADELQRFLEIFDRRSDTAIVGAQTVHVIELEDA